MSLDHVWGKEYMGDPKIVDVNIRRLRQKSKAILPSRNTSRRYGDTAINGRVRDNDHQKAFGGKSSHYFLVVFIALSLIEVIFLIALRSYYYDTVYNHIVNHINTANAFYQPFRLTSTDNVNQLSEMIRHFELYTTELQILNPGGQVLHIHRFRNRADHQDQ